MELRNKTLPYSPRQEVPQVALLFLCLVATLGSPQLTRAAAQLTSFVVSPSGTTSSSDAPPQPPAPTTPTVQPRGVRPLTAGGGGSLDPTQQYGDLIRSQTDVGVLDDKLLGETVDYYTGRTDFAATDVSLPGNFALPVAVSRRYHVANQAGGQLQGAFGDWDLEIPHIEGVIATSIGWVGPMTNGAYNPYECETFEELPAASVTTTLSGGGTVTSSLSGDEYNNGFSIVIPGKG
ncbi:MAG: hypothetical protein JSS28_06935, partial [Proteobacteria bacterium]|nr:hypothetical protein [Pseudomonadota bacterium]